MELFWYLVLMTMLAVYVILDGYDFGAGIIHLFFAKTEKDKKAITNAIGPFWDANEVWLIASGGVLFFAFPTLYASSFSGFYLPLIMILWLLIFRAIGLELRGQIHNSMWETVWDKHLSILDWFTILLGVIGVISLTIHGANWIIFKTNSDLNQKLKRVIFNLNFVLLALIIISLFVWHVIEPQPFHNFIENPWLWIFPIITFTGLFGLFKVKSFKKDGLGFLFSSLFLFGGLGTTVASIFPKVLPSTNTVNPSLTIYNVAADSYGLSVGVYWFVIAVILVAIYMIIQYKVFKGKMDDVGYGEH